MCSGASTQPAARARLSSATRDASAACGPSPPSTRSCGPDGPSSGPTPSNSRPTTSTPPCHEPVGPSRRHCLTSVWRQASATSTPTRPSFMPRSLPHAPAPRWMHPSVPDSPLPSAPSSEQPSVDAVLLSATLWTLTTDRAAARSTFASTAGRVSRASAAEPPSGPVSLLSEPPCGARYASTNSRTYPHFSPGYIHSGAGGYSLLSSLLRISTE